MLELIPWIPCAVAGAIYALSPLLVRNSFRFASHCRLDAVSLERLPEQIGEEFGKRTSQFRALGFELLGCFDCGALANDTRSYIAYFCNYATNEFANVCAMMTLDGPASYFEFSSRFADGRSVETNTNEILPLMPANRQIQVFRFAWVEEPRALLEIHRQLAEKYAPGLCALGEPRDAEIRRYLRIIEDFGPRLAQTGYLKLDGAGESFRPTWKGAIRMAWLGLWPVSFLRRAIQRHAMQLELRSLQTRTEAALQKA